MLIALSTGQRVQTISLIKLNNIRNTTNGLEISITDLIKTSGPGRDQPFLKLPKFEDNPEICVASTILSYIQYTSKLRVPTENRLFISIRKPHKAVSKQTISKWIKQCLNESGVDVAIFSGHSTRHAATSAAAASGLDFDTIRKSAGWSAGSKVFANFYNRPLITDSYDFANCVLSR